METNEIVIKLDRCYECEKTDVKIHQHHVIPQIKGGVKTIPLCIDCHGKVHGIDMTHWSHLAKVARDKKIAEAKEKGEPSPFGRSKGAVETFDIFIKKDSTKKIIDELNKGMSVRTIAKKLGVSFNLVVKIRKWVAKEKPELLTNLNKHMGRKKWLGGVNG